MNEIDRRASKFIESFCIMGGSLCINAKIRPIDDPGFYCSVQSPTEVIECFEGQGCTKAVVLEGEGNSLVKRAGVMTRERFTPNQTDDNEGNDGTIWSG